MSADDIERFLPLTPLSLAVLLGLADGARHGYAIMKEVERQTDGRIRPGAGSLYAALQRLLDDGLIATAPAGADGEPANARRRYYVLEDRGRAVARAELLRMARVIQLGHDRRLVPELRLAIGPIES
jgi:DNA-binding PadR family transcriptional regulator